MKDQNSTLVLKIRKDEPLTFTLDNGQVIEVTLAGESLTQPKLRINAPRSVGIKRFGVS